MSEILNILGSVGFNWHVALANFVNFLIILFLLNKFFFGKIGKTLDERESVIEHGLNQAKEAEMKLANANEEKESLMRQAYKEKDAMLKNAEGEAHARAQAITDEAEKIVETRNKKLDEKEASLRETVEKTFGESAPALVAKLYEKTLLREMSKEDNDALIARMSA